MIFNNTWFCNWYGDQHGIMEFAFDLVWRKTLAGEGQPAEIATALATDPALMLNDRTVEEPLLMKRLFHP